MVWEPSQEKRLRFKVTVRCTWYDAEDRYGRVTYDDGDLKYQRDQFYAVEAVLDAASSTFPQSSGMPACDAASLSRCKVTSRPRRTMVSAMPGPGLPPATAHRRYRFTALSTSFLGRGSEDFLPAYSLSYGSSGLAHSVVTMSSIAVLRLDTVQSVGEIPLKSLAVETFHPCLDASRSIR